MNVLRNQKGEQDWSISLLTILFVIGLIGIVYRPISSATYTPYTQQIFSPKNDTAKIDVYNDKPSLKYTELGEIKAYETITYEKTLAKIFKKACEIGADGIIIKERGKDYLIAIAIKYK